MGFLILLEREREGGRRAASSWARLSWARLSANFGSSFSRTFTTGNERRFKLEHEATGAGRGLCCTSLCCTKVLLFICAMTCNPRCSTVNRDSLKWLQSEQHRQARRNQSPSVPRPCTHEHDRKLAASKKPEITKYQIRLKSYLKSTAAGLLCSPKQQITVEQ